MNTEKPGPTAGLLRVFRGGTTTWRWKSLPSAMAVKGSPSARVLFAALRPAFVAAQSEELYVCVVRKGDVAKVCRLLPMASPARQFPPRYRIERRAKELP